MTRIEGGKGRGAPGFGRSVRLRAEERNPAGGRGEFDRWGRPGSGRRGREREASRRRLTGRKRWLGRQEGGLVGRARPLGPKRRGERGLGFVFSSFFFFKTFSFKTLSKFKYFSNFKNFKLLSNFQIILKTFKTSH
jgi:hypothetical protein